MAGGRALRFSDGVFLICAALLCTSPLAASQRSLAAALRLGNEFPGHKAPGRSNQYRQAATKTVRKVYNFTEDVLVKGVSIHDDIYTEVIFLRHILNFIVLPGDGSPSRPARSCRSLMIAHPTKINGFYYIDPNGGDTVDKLHVYCNFTGGGWTIMEPTVRRSKISTTALKHGLKSFDNYTWHSTTDRFFKIDYLESAQLKLLQVQSQAVRQVLVFRCVRQSVRPSDILPSYFDGLSETVVKMRGQDRSSFKGQDSSSVQVDVLRNDCDGNVNRGRSILQLTASNANMAKLPIVDFAVHDINPSERVIVLNKATLMYL